MPAPNSFEGDLVRLTAFRNEDIETLWSWYQDSAFMRLFDSRPADPLGKREIAARVERMKNSKNDYVFAVRPIGSEQIIGYLEIDGIDWVHRVAGIGIGFGSPEHWGKGYGFEAAKLALQFAFQTLNLHRIQATVFAYNQRSIALFEKLAFKREGTFRERLERDGQRWDMHLYALLRHEWESRRGFD